MRTTCKVAALTLAALSVAGTAQAANVYVVGDSITRMTFDNKATDGLPSTWVADAVSGRRVTALDQHMTTYSTNMDVRRHRYFNIKPGSVSTLVLALGS